MKLQSFTKLVLTIILAVSFTSYTQAQSENSLTDSIFNLSNNYSESVTENTKVDSKNVVFANESNRNIRYIIKMKNQNGEKIIWKSGYLGKNGAKSLKIQNDEISVTSIKMIYKNGFKWKVYNLKKFNGKAKDLPQKFVFTGVVEQKPIIKFY